MGKRRKDSPKTTFRAIPREWGWLWRGKLNPLLYRLSPRDSGLGEWGEWLALLHLRRLRWDIVSRNWTVKQGELDLVAFHDETLVFLEVKTRSGKTPPEENFTPRKQRQMESLCDLFRVRYEVFDQPFRCDLIAVETHDYRHFELRHWLL